ncbi:ROK family protein [Solibacillus sp. MA9]|uniref:ROK family protein n=1 Tax=Solibacillus palustris TaxID=2908203 RepID=A0ABS9UF96_9BACL|nr:ROK family protein [Solibacillus sp. MA9]MCH7322933.1 ROK family protein [Solibacillus sp. MA9]
MSYTLVADVGGTKLATAIFNKEERLLSKLEVPSDTSSREALYQSLVKSFEQLCTEKAISFDEISKVSIGLPGIVDIEKGIAVYQNNIPWANFPICDCLAEVFQNAEVKMDNDVYMATWGEYCARSFSKETMVYVTLSTGISCCTIVNGEFLRGTGLAGEIGFHILDGEGRTLEQTVAGPTIEKVGRDLLGNPNITLKEMMELYYQGNAIVGTILEPLIQAMVKQLHQMILLLDPHCIVLGGGFFNHHPKVIEQLKLLLQQSFAETPFAEKEQIIESSLNKGEAGLFGAAAK